MAVAIGRRVTINTPAGRAVVYSSKLTLRQLRVDLEAGWGRGRGDGRSAELMLMSDGREGCRLPEQAVVFT